MPRRQKPEVKWYRIIYRGLHAAALLGEGGFTAASFPGDSSGPRSDSSRPQNGFVFGPSQSTAKTCDRQGYRCPFEWCPPTTVRPAGELISIRGNSAAACTGTSPRQDWVAIPQAPTVVCLIASTGSHRRRSPTPMPLRVRSTHSRQIHSEAVGMWIGTRFPTRVNGRPFGSSSIVYSTGMPIELTRERLKVREIREKIFYSVGHCWTVALLQGQCRLIYARKRSCQQELGVI